MRSPNPSRGRSSGPSGPHTVTTELSFARRSRQTAKKPAGRTYVRSTPTTTTARAIHGDRRDDANADDSSVDVGIGTALVGDDVASAGTKGA